jgi:ubiquinone/menaquinone biosynthesis C-methylase UbiE
MNRELERFDPAEQAGRISYEHLHRYALSREYVSGKRVLDLGCGTGYGSSILAVAAAQVTGVDLSGKAIQSAQRRYGAATNLRYLCGDCYGLPFEKNSFDVVVANEMIEHVEDHDALIAEALRVLASDGLFIVSTPNKPVYNRYKAPNAFHVSEMDVPEFRALLQRHFAHVRLIGIRMALVSAGFALNDSERSANSSTALIYRGTRSADEEPGVHNGQFELGDPEYVLAVCSQRDFERQESSSSVFYSRDDDLWLEHEKIMAWAAGLHDEDELLRADLVQVKSQLEASGAVLASARQEHDILQAHLNDLRDVSRASTEALDRQREVIEREASKQIDMTSRLLGKMNGVAVSNDPIALVEAMFDVHAKLVAQELQLARLDAVEQQLAALRRRAEEQDARAVELEAEVARLNDVERYAAELDRELPEIRRRAEEDRARGAELDAEVARLKDVERHAVWLDRELVETRRRAEELDARVAELDAEVARLKDVEQHAAGSDHDLVETRRRAALSGRFPNE